MHNTLIITQKELKSYFTSAIAYVVGAIFLALSGYFFSLILFYSKSTSLEPVMANMAFVLLFVLPLVSMRLIAEEKRSGTIEILLTRPIKDWQVILGKFLAAWILFLVMLAFTGIYIAVVAKFGSPEFPVILSGYLGLILVGACILALGTFFSTVTSNQIVAGALSFAVVLVIWLLSHSAGATGGKENILSYLSLSTHLEDYTRGIIDIKNTIYYLSFIFFWLYLATRTLEARRWRQ